MALESDKGMVSIFVDYYLEGMLVGTAIMLSPGGLYLIVYLKEKKTQALSSLT